jgi:hypothetical protein
MLSLQQRILERSEGRGGENVLLSHAKAWTLQFVVCSQGVGVEVSFCFVIILKLYHASSAFGIVHSVGKYSKT